MIAIPDAKARRGNRMVRVGPTGIPDIIGVCGPAFKHSKHLGMLIAVEVKVPGNKPTEAQERMIGELRAHGAYVGVIHSVDELESWLASL